MKKRNSFVLLIAGVIGLITICTILYVFPAQEIVVPDGNGISVIYTSLLSKNILILLFVVSVSMVFISITTLIVIEKKENAFLDEPMQR